LRLEQLRLERQELEVNREKVWHLVNEIHDREALKIVRFMMAENHHIASDLLIGLYAREACAADESYPALYEEMRRIDNLIEIKRRRSKRSATL
jgi:hypothetical protein